MDNFVKSELEIINKLYQNNNINKNNVEDIKEEINTNNNDINIIEKIELPEIKEKKVNRRRLKKDNNVKVIEHPKEEINKEPIEDVLDISNKFIMKGNLRKVDIEQQKNILHQPKKEIINDIPVKQNNKQIEVKQTEIKQPIQKVNINNDFGLINPNYLRYMIPLIPIIKVLAGNYF